MVSNINERQLFSLPHRSFFTSHTPGECVLLRRVCTNDIILMTCVASTAFRSIPGKVLESEMQELFNHTVDPVRAFQ